MMFTRMEAEDNRRIADDHRGRDTARWYVSAKFTPTAVLRRRTWPRVGDPTLISSHTKLSAAPFLWMTAAIPMWRLVPRGSQLSRANSSAHTELFLIDMLAVSAIGLKMVAAE